MDQAHASHANVGGARCAGGLRALSDRDLRTQLLRHVLENADLCEYLASHGYVVIASPDMGASTRT